MAHGIHYRNGWPNWSRPIRQWLEVLVLHLVSLKVRIYLSIVLQLIVSSSSNVSAIVFTYLLCPETKGRTLEEVDYLFVGRALAGLQSSSVGDLERVEKRMYEDAVRHGSVSSLEHKAMMDYKELY